MCLRITVQNAATMERVAKFCSAAAAVGAFLKDYHVTINSEKIEIKQGESPFIIVLRSGAPQALRVKWWPVISEAAHFKEFCKAVICSLKNGKIKDCAGHPVKLFAKMKWKELVDDMHDVREAWKKIKERRQESSR